MNFHTNMGMDTNTDAVTDMDIVRVCIHVYVHVRACVHMHVHVLSRPSPCPCPCPCPFSRPCPCSCSCSCHFYVWMFLCLFQRQRTCLLNTRKICHGQLSVLRTQWIEATDNFQRFFRSIQRTKSAEVTLKVTYPALHNTDIHILYPYNNNTEYREFSGQENVENRKKEKEWKKGKLSSSS
jgi:hypothetical protein